MSLTEMTSHPARLTPLCGAHASHASGLVVLALASFLAGMLVGDTTGTRSMPTAKPAEPAIHEIEDWHGNVRRSHGR